MALELKSECEKCLEVLADNTDAYICSYECSFCPDCACELNETCPNCGGELVLRPKRLAPQARETTSNASDMQPKSPALDPRSLKMQTGTSYPSPHDEICANRMKARLGDTLGLNNFGVNYVCLPPGTASSQRHWHTKQDEFIYIIKGQLVLVTDAGAQVMCAGTVAGFPAGKPDGHQLINRTDKDAFYMEVGDRTEGDTGEYSDIDMRAVRDDSGFLFVHKDGTPYPKKGEK